MFNLAGSEIIFLLLAGLVVLGPERLPGVMRNVGRVYGQLRQMTQGLEKEIKDTFSEPVSDLRRTADEIRAGFGQVDTEPSPPMRPERSASLEELAEQGLVDSPHNSEVADSDRDSTGTSDSTGTGSGPT